MPALAFLAVAGLALIALLFFADAALEKSNSPVIRHQPTLRSARVVAAF